MFNYLRDEVIFCVQPQQGIYQLALLKGEFTAIVEQKWSRSKPKISI